MRSAEFEVAKTRAMACVGCMCRTLRVLGVCLLLGIAVPAGAQEKGRPQFRPAVLGTSSDSLINRIDTKELLKKGQKDGAVMFCALVSPNGKAQSAWTYRPMPDTEALREELEKRLVEAKFTPPIYQYQPVSVLLFGTAVFSVASAHHIQILLNQDPDELKKASDFIAPQPVIGGDSKFRGLTPPETGTTVSLTAVVDLGLKVNKQGELKELRVLAEEPPLLGFGAAAEADLREAKFIPAFRLGDPEDSDIVQPICYKPAEPPMSDAPIE